MKRFAEFLGGALIVACLFSVGWEPTPVLAQDEEAGKEVASNQGDIFSGLKGLKGLKDLKADGELSIETDENNEILQFQMSDNVVVVSEELDLKCDLLIYNPKTECLIAKATVSGHRVIVRTPDIKASCLELRIYTEEKPQRFVLTGSPVVVKQGMNMAGEEITLFKSEKGGTKVKVRGPRMNSTTSGDKSDPFAGIGDTPSAEKKGEKKPTADGETKPEEKGEKKEGEAKATDETKGSLAEIPKATESQTSSKTEKTTRSDSKSGTRKKAAVSN